LEYDTSIIRPEIRFEDVKIRGVGYDEERRKEILKALRFLHAREIMAANVYKCQIKSKACKLNTWLTAGMASEMTHVSDFQTKLYEFGAKPSKSRFVFWFAGYVFGFGSRILGEERMLRTGVWVEEEAVKHYQEVLDRVDWDDETRAFVEKDQQDEYAHIERWKTLLGEPGYGCRQD
jgi:ubiquinone biosynthesis monooxygenase Coq7